MKRFWKEFFLRGMLCAGSGPLVLAIIYGILGATGAVTQLAPREVCVGILTIMLLAFIAAGMTAVYQIEQLPLPTAIMLHCGALYIAYLLTYLINGWLLKQLTTILIFTGIFVAGYAIIWLIIYLFSKTKTKKINRKLNELT